jgi:hypothetical protein
MTPMLVPMLVPMLTVSMIRQPATAPSASADADELARQVMKASGGGAWPRVTRIKFTFNVDRDGTRAASVAHDWDVRGGTDTVTWNGKTVAVNLRESNHDGDAKQAYARWVNDSYWLLAPLKVMDPGVARTTGPSETIDGRSYDLLHLSFENVGLTPSDQYNLWIDPQTKLVRYWDYIPAKGESRRFTWEDYRDFNGLKLATKHAAPGGAVISFSDVEVTTE